MQNFLLRPDILDKFKDATFVFIWTNVGAVTEEVDYVFGYEMFDFWVDAKKHMKRVYDSKLFPDNVAYYLYIPQKKVIYQIYLSQLDSYNNVWKL